MTDREKLVALLQGWKVPYAERGGQVIVGDWAAFQAGLAVHPGEASRVDGYMGFHTVFRFGPDGSFLKMGAWE